MITYFYFIRHGQSILNTQGIRQSDNGSLSDTGVEQAHIVGERLHQEELFTRQKIKKVFSSPYERAKETAHIISSHLHSKKTIVYSDLLKERRNPSDIIGKSTNDISVRKIIEQIDKSYHADDFRHLDEENFTDLKKRAIECLSFLARNTAYSHRVVVVTHGIFLRMLIAYMTYGDSLTADLYSKLSFLNSVDNAGITLCSYTHGLFVPKSKHKWELLAWNVETGNVRGATKTNI